MWRQEYYISEIAQILSIKTWTVQKLLLEALQIEAVEKKLDGGI